MSTSNLSESTPEYDLAFRIFFPHPIRRMEEMRRSDKKFVHYTSAETALSIIRERKVWMRNAMVMNDFNEIHHGFDCLKYSLTTEPGQNLKDRINRVHPEAFEQIVSQVDDHLPTIRYNTYITSISEHQNFEQNGRLSMWRAYAPKNGVALILNKEAFLQPSDALKAYTSPVAYCDQGSYPVYIQEILDKIDENKNEFDALPLVDIQHNFLAP